MGSITAHEFISLDGVFEDPVWTFDFNRDPKMDDDTGDITRPCTAILLGRNTFEAFAPAWSTRTVEDDPGALGKGKRLWDDAADHLSAMRNHYSTR